MPDDRLIHLAFGHSQKINALSDFERLVWLVYKLSADDFGVMRFSAAPLQASAGFLEARPSKSVLRALEATRDRGLIASFTHQGATYAFQPDWQTWQKITHPRATKQPGPPLAELDDNTRWLFTKHPNGGKLPSWKPPGKLPEETGSKPEANPENSSPVLVGVGNGGVLGGVSGRGDAPLPARGLTPGVMAGTLPRDHLNCHGPCERICISEKQHAILCEKYGSDRQTAAAVLDAFYAEVRAALDRNIPITESSWPFWDRQFQARFGGPVPTGKTAGNYASLERFVARGQP